MKPRSLQPHAWALTKLLRGFLRSLALSRLFPVTVTGRRYVPAKGAALVACNHISLADPPYVWGALRRNAAAMATRGLWRIPVLGMILWLLGHVPVHRGNHASGLKATAKLIRHLKAGGLGIIFPEGRCSPTGQLQKLKPGVAVIAFATGAPVIPAGVQGTNVVWPLGSRRIRMWQRVTVAFGEPMMPADYPDQSTFLADLANRIAELSGQSPVVTTD